MATTTPVGTPSRAALLVLALTAVVYAALYARVARFGYVWDDLATIRDSPQFERPLSESLRVTQHGHLDETLTKLRQVVPQHDSYRPLLFLTYAAEVRLFGKSPAAMHVTNAMMGFLAALVAFAVASRLLRSRMAGAAVAAIYALHPLQVESISYISARADLLAGLLALTSVWLALLAAERQRAARVALIAGSCLVFAGSLFVKESTVALPLALAALSLIGPRRRLLAPCLALAVVVPAYFVVRALLLAGAPAMVQDGVVLRGALAVPGLALNYLTLFIAPAHLSIVRPMRPEFVVAGWMAVAFVLAVLLLSLRRRPLPPAAVEVLAGLGWVVATVGPSAVVAAIMDVAADRYAYLPLFGFSLAAVALVRVLWEARPAARRIMVATGGAWVLLCAGVSHLAIGVWTDPYQLYANAVTAEPDSSKARYGIGVVFANLGLWRESVVSFEAATRLDPSNLRAWSNLSVGYETLGRLDDGERAARRAIHLSDGTHFRAWYNLATVQQRQGRDSESCTSLERALAINPGYLKAETEAVARCGRAPRSEIGRR
jgi:tetratricopeptide (TPR) repeat protein